MTVETCTAWTPILTCDLSSMSPTVTGAALQAATDVLDSLSGHRFGGCQVSIRPCRRECSGMSWGILSGTWWNFGYWPRPLFYRGVWSNITCASCPDGSCACTALSEVRLPAVAASVQSVKVDGVTLVKDTDYRVDNFRTLVRLGGAVWPICNELTLDDTHVGTWSVTATYGETPPQIAQLALGELTCELAKLLSGNTDCKLPTPVQTLVRQGVTMNFLDPNMVFAQGRVGLYLCDLFIETVNPKRLLQAAQVFDVDGMNRHRITGTA